jgi:hypothetical protein
MALASRPAVVATVLAALTTAACTVLSGVDGYELRTGPRVDPVATDGAPSRADANDASSEATTGSPCATAQACQEERCRNDLPDSRLEQIVSSALAVTATCTAGAPFVISPGPDHYYGADVRCTLAPQPEASNVLVFPSYMQTLGWNGFILAVEGSDYVVIGQSTTRLCNTY